MEHINDISEKLKELTTKASELDQLSEQISITLLGYSSERDQRVTNSKDNLTSTGVLDTILLVLNDLQYTMDTTYTNLNLIKDKIY